MIKNENSDAVRVFSDETFSKMRIPLQKSAKIELSLKMERHSK
ncbi:hypothetical protein [Lactococcus nasutitermitis]|nr:hypothetical protein [Lactococcus nasutitermitis]